MKEKRVNRQTIRGAVLLISAIIILIFILFTNKENNLKAHCQKAICNEDASICYNYELDKDGKTIKTWEGNCQNIK